MLLGQLNNITILHVHKGYTDKQNMHEVANEFRVKMDFAFIFCYYCTDFPYVNDVCL